MLIHTRRLLLSLVLGGACATTASAQELLINPAGSNITAPPIAGVQEPIPAIPTAQIAEATPPVPSTILTPVPDDGVGTVRVSDCPQNGEGEIERRKHAPPTAGWVAPGRIAMNRMWVPYHKFYPNAWTGQPAVPQARLPVIYTPTDTTQLGYYYQHVPHWHSYSNMIPPVPRPVDWHYSYQVPRTVRRVVAPTPSDDLGQPMPMPEGQQPAPPPPPQSDLDKSAAAPELLPLMR
jgi:hypothetical protein